MKKVFALLIVTVFCIPLFAQYSSVPPPSFPKNIQPPDFPNNNGFMFAPSYQAPVYRCVLYLSNGKTIEGESGIYGNTNLGYFIEIKKKKYEPFDTDSVYVNQCKGIPEEDHWLFQTVNGELNVFNKFPVNNLGKTSFLKIDNKMKPYNKKNLEEIIKDDPPAFNLYNQINRKKNYCVLFNLGWNSFFFDKFFCYNFG